MRRLRASRQDWVRQERKRMMEILMAKYVDHFGKLRRACEDGKKVHEIALMASKISGTIDCLKFMRDYKGVAVPPKELERLETDFARWTTKYEVLDIVEVTDADFVVTPPDERLSPNSVPARGASVVENVHGVGQFGSNIGTVTPSDASLLRIPRGSWQDG